jgi:hypothetical protein
MLLDRLIDELGRARGPLTTRALARRVGIDESALAGMLGVLAAKGILSVPSELAGSGPAACTGAACGKTCVGLDRCPFVAKTPDTHAFVVLGREPQ